MTDRPTDPSTPTGGSPATGGSDDDRFAELVEKSLRGALNPAEQQELGALIGSSPQLAELARTLHHEDLTMQTMIQDAENTFDPDRARRSIDAALNETRTHWRLMPIYFVLIAGGIVALNLATGRLPWPAVFVGCAIIAVVLLLQALWRTNRSRTLAAEAGADLPGLASAYEKREKETDRWTMLYRGLAVAAPVVVFAYLIGALLDESGSTAMRWAIGIIFVLTLPNLWFAFNRRHVERVRARMLGLGDKTPADRDNDHAD